MRVLRITDSENEQRGMVMSGSKLGVYVNKKTGKAMRVSAPPLAPPETEWVRLADDPNLGILAIRDLARSKGIVPTPDTIQWQ
ncbi:MAG: hypothetical protein HY677_04765 [Chloroflexi bacterium]|nr:hypothetical protein [Chloroflexota bacterium]